MTRDKIHPELRALLSELVGDGLCAEGRVRLEQILAGDVASLEFYRKYMIVEAALQWQSHSVLRASAIAPDISEMPSDLCAKPVPIAPTAALDPILPDMPDPGQTSGSSTNPVLGFLGGALCQAGEFLNRPTPFWVLISATVLVPLASLFLVVIMSTARYERLVDERIAADRTATVERVAAGQNAANEQLANEQLASERAANKQLVGESTAGENATAQRKAEDQPVCIAYLECQSDDARWSSQQNAALLGIGMQCGRELRLTAGLAEIAFESGAKVILQAPVTFVLDGKNAGSLEDGKITAYVPPSAQGFCVKSEQVTVVDLGTEFGMQVMGHTGAEVHVFTGVVEAELAARNGDSRFGRMGSTPLRLEKDVALRIDQLAVTVLKKLADPDQFVRRMPGTGVTDRPLVRNPSFEYPPIESHPRFNGRYGNTNSLSIAGWEEQGFSGGSGPNADYQISPYGFSVRRRRCVGPGATDGKQVATLTLRSEESEAGSVNETWIFQALGTFVPNDVGKTLEVRVDVAANNGDFQGSGLMLGEGAMVIVAFATDVSSMNMGNVVGNEAADAELMRSEGVKTLTAGLTIGKELIGKCLYIRLSAANAKMKFSSEQYHYDNVRYRVKE